MFLALATSKEHFTMVGMNDVKFMLLANEMETMTRICKTKRDIRKQNKNKKTFCCCCCRWW